MKRTENQHWTALLILAGILLAGCSTLADLETPELTLVQLQVVEATLFETTLQVQLRIANPNPESITFEGASFKLTLDDRKVGRGMTPESRTVDRFGTEVVDVTFHVSNASVLLRLREILDSKSVAYGVSGKLYLQIDGRSHKLKVENEGQVDLNLDGSAAGLDAETPVPDPEG